MKHCIFKHFQHQLALFDPGRLSGDDEENGMFYFIQMNGISYGQSE